MKPTPHAISIKTLQERLVDLLGGMDDTGGINVEGNRIYWEHESGTELEINIKYNN